MDSRGRIHELQNKEIEGVIKIVNQHNKIFNPRMLAKLATIPPGDVERVKAMSRKDRRQWFKNKGTSND